MINLIARLRTLLHGGAEVPMCRWQIGCVRDAAGFGYDRLMNPGVPLCGDHLGMRRATP